MTDRQTEVQTERQTEKQKGGNDRQNCKLMTMAALSWSEQVESDVEESAPIAKNIAGIRIRIWKITHIFL